MKNSSLKPGTQLLPYMKRLLPSLEGRFQAVESEQDIVNELAEEIRAAALHADERDSDSGH